MSSIFGSSSNSKSSNPNSSITASDNAIVQRFQGRAGSTTTTVKVNDNDRYNVAKGGTLTFGIDDATFSNTFEGLKGSISDLGKSLLSAAAPRQDTGLTNSVIEAINARTDANTEAALDDIETGKASNVSKWVKWAVGAVVVVALFVYFRKKS